METDGDIAIFRRSIEKLGLMYKKYVGDGDSKLYTTVSNAQPYGPLEFIEKEECISHITKRMGNGLREIFRKNRGKKLRDGKCIGGRGRLTISRIDTIQKFYGLALRTNKVDSKKMAKATHAILKHYSSTLEDPHHEDCPTGKDSWCSYNRDVATGKSTHKPIKNPLPPDVVSAVAPLFNRLGSEQFLASCEECKTQNLNESYHHVVWTLAPKDQFNSSLETKLAVEIGTMFFNQGYNKTFFDIITSLKLTVSQNMTMQWCRMDNNKIRTKQYMESQKCKQRRKTLKRKKEKTMSAFSHVEAVQYKSGQFHEGDKKKKKKKL